MRSDDMNIGVVGAGSWGTALAKVLGEKGHTVRMWSYEESVADQLRRWQEQLGIGS